MSKQHIPIDPAGQAAQGGEEGVNAANRDVDTGTDVGISESSDPAVRIEMLEAENARLRDQTLRTLAEFDNFKRRSQQERESFAQYANENLLRAILPIFDDFQRSVEAGERSRDFDSFFQGVSMINGKLLRILEGLGVTRIPTVGEPFSVDLHEALMRQPSDSPEDTVIGELEPGYRYGDRVLRHAKVIVSAG